MVDEQSSVALCSTPLQACYLSSDGFIDY